MTMAILLFTPKMLQGSRLVVHDKYREEEKDLVLAGSLLKKIKYLKQGLKGRNVGIEGTHQKNVVFYCILRLEAQGDAVKTGGNETDTYLRVLGCPSHTVAKGKVMVLEFKTIPHKTKQN